MDEDQPRFKVPPLRNVAMTLHYTHRQCNDLPTMDRLMGREMLKTDLRDREVSDFVASPGSLTGEIRGEFLTLPVLPNGGADGDFGPELAPSTKN